MKIEFGPITDSNIEAAANYIYDSSHELLNFIFRDDVTAKRALNQLLLKDKGFFGHFILRDHDAASEEMKTFCSLVHTVFNAGLSVTWERLFSAFACKSLFVKSRRSKDRLGPLLLMGLRQWPSI